MTLADDARGDPARSGPGRRLWSCRQRESTAADRSTRESSLRRPRAAAESRPDRDAPRRRRVDRLPTAAAAFGGRRRLYRRRRVGGGSLVRPACRGRSRESGRADTRNPDRVFRDIPSQSLATERQYVPFRALPWTGACSRLGCPPLQASDSEQQRLPIP